VYCQFKKKRLGREVESEVRPYQTKRRNSECLESLLVWFLKDITNELAPQ
jgi:hypothetical protein